MSHEHASELTDWFAHVQRDFPWRKDRTAYRVLVSEIMLQQTRAAAVVAFYERWIKRFPDFLTLSKASDLDVIKFWEGLGYYSRARNLKQIAIAVMEKFNGEFPSSYENILSFKGIGVYTAAAISHFAFNKRAIGADGNINRVIARFYGYTERVDRKGGVLHLLDQFIPAKRSDQTFEALIELGATICTKKPKCIECPLRDGCKAFQEELQSVIPVIKQKPKIQTLNRIVFIIEVNGSVVIKRECRNLMKGLYEFPYLEEDSSINQLGVIESLFLCRLKKTCEHKKVVHYFTKYKAVLSPITCAVFGSITLPDGYELICKEKLGELPFSSGHKKIRLQDNSLCSI